jgi:hypothetical protein
VADDPFLRAFSETDNSKMKLKTSKEKYLLSWPHANTPPEILRVNEVLKPARGQEPDCDS